VSRWLARRQLERRHRIGRGCHIATVAALNFRVLRIKRPFCDAANSDCSCPQGGTNATSDTRRPLPVFTQQQTFHRVTLREGPSQKRTQDNLCSLPALALELHRHQRLVLRSCASRPMATPEPPPCWPNTSPSADAVASRAQSRCHSLTTASHVIGTMPA
jgi:hypothetical protein